MAEHFGSTAKAHTNHQDGTIVPMPKEGEMTKKVEQVTARVPSMGYLGLALGSMALSAGLAAFTRKKDLSVFVGLWVPTLMLVGIYNKLVKLEGSDQYSQGRS